MEKSKSNTAVIVAVIAAMASIIVALINNRPTTEPSTLGQKDNIEVTTESMGTTINNHTLESDKTSEVGLKKHPPSSEPTTEEKVQETHVKHEPVEEVKYGLKVTFVDEISLAPIEGVFVSSNESGLSTTSNGDGSIGIPKTLVDSIGQYGAINCLLSHKNYKNEGVVISLSENQIFKLKPE